MVAVQMEVGERDGFVRVVKVERSVVNARVSGKPLTMLDHTCSTRSPRFGIDNQLLLYVFIAVTIYPMICTMGR